MGKVEQAFLPFIFKKVTRQRARATEAILEIPNACQYSYAANGGSGISQ
jgi:hypothetical protein